MIVHRRVFQAKVGEAAGVVAKIKEFEQMAARYGWPKGRILTDYLSGQTDRVAYEMEVASIGEVEHAFGAVLQHPEGQKAFQDWFGGLKPLIEGATVEYWSREDG